VHLSIGVQGGVYVSEVCMYLNKYVYGVCV